MVCSRAAQMHLACRLRPAGHVLVKQFVPNSEYLKICTCAKGLVKSVTDFKIILIGNVFGVLQCVSQIYAS
jgi:hypothetical protein